MTLRVLVIQNDATVPPGLVGEWLRGEGLVVDVVAAYAGERVPVAVPAEVDGVVALGGEMGALADHEASWLPAERDLLRDAVAREVPVLGLCLGGQLLAAATGGRVGTAVAAEAGVYSMQAAAALASDDVFSGLVGQPMRAAQWHVDAVETLPPDATLLMTNDACPIQAFRVGGFAWGVQFHPEVDAAIVEGWVGDDGALRAAGVTADDAVDQVRQAYDELVATWQPVIARWAHVVGERASR